jgi:MFS family permease
MGSMFFIGVISTVLIIPPLSDKWLGRKAVFIGGVLVYLIAYVGIIFSTNLYEFYVFQFLNGASYASKVIVGLNYLTEFIPSYKQEGMVYTFLIVEPTTIILLTFWY